MMPGDAVPDGVIVEPGGDGMWAWVGLRLWPAPVLDENRAYVDVPEPQRRSEALVHEQAWLAALWTTANRTSFEVRYLNVPQSRRVSGVLLGRVHAHDKAAGAAAAIALRDRLAAAPEHVRADPSYDAAEVYRWLSPLRPHQNGLFEVRKPLSWALCTRVDTHRRVCFAVSPFTATHWSWEPLWDKLARLSWPTVVSIGLEPYAIGYDLRTQVGLLAQEYTRLAESGSTHPVWSRSAPPDPFAVIAAPLYIDATRRYIDRAYRMRISIASAGPLPADFPELVAATVSSRTPGTAIGGAAAVRRPPPTEFDAAWNNIAALNRGWLDETYRQGAPLGFLNETERILCDLVDTTEAAAAFRLPYEIPGHKPLFTTPGRPAKPSPQWHAPHSDSRDPGAPVFE